MTHIIDQKKNSNQSLRAEVHVDDFLKLVGCKIFTKKLLKLNSTHEYLPIAWGLTNIYFYIYNILTLKYLQTKHENTKNTNFLSKCLKIFIKWFGYT